MSEYFIPRVLSLGTLKFQATTVPGSSYIQIHAYSDEEGKSRSFLGAFVPDLQHNFTGQAEHCWMFPHIGRMQANDSAITHLASRLRQTLDIVNTEYLAEIIWCWCQEVAQRRHEDFQRCCVQREDWTARP